MQDTPASDAMMKFDDYDSGQLHYCRFKISATGLVEQSRIRKEVQACYSAHPDLQSPKKSKAGYYGNPRSVTLPAKYNAGVHQSDQTKPRAVFIITTADG